MNSEVVAVLLFFISFAPASRALYWPEEINDLDMYQNETKLHFEYINIPHMSSDWLNRLVAVNDLELKYDRIDKVYVKPELHKFSMDNIDTKEVEIDPVKNYQTTYLALRQCSLRALPSHLNRLTNVTKLVFFGNFIESVNMDDLSDLKKLEFIHFGTNRLKQFDATMEIRLPKLETIFLSFNQLTTFEVCYWKLPNLQKIELESNKLSHVVLNPWEFPKLNKISLALNPVDCFWLHEFREKFESDILVVRNCKEYQSNGSFPIGCSEAYWSQCGHRQKIPAELIVNSQNAIRGHWPWHTALYRNNGTHFNYACGGTLISRNFVLTAAHCIVVVRGRLRQPISNNQLMVRLGMHILDQIDPETQEFMISKIYKYDTFIQHVDDISLLKLEGEAVFTAFVQPICIDDSGELIGQYGTVAGWGLRGDDKLASVLQSTQMPVHELLQCLKSSRLFFGRTLDHGVLCVGYLNGTSVCNGDSGGGLYFLRKNTWYIGGIVAFSEYRTGNRALCKTDGYAGFTNVSQHAAWIERSIVLETSINNESINPPTQHSVSFDEQQHSNKTTSGSKTLATASTYPTIVVTFIILSSEMLFYNFFANR